MIGLIKRKIRDLYLHGIRLKIGGVRITALELERMLKRDFEGDLKSQYEGTTTFMVYFHVEDNNLVIDEHEIPEGWVVTSIACFTTNEIDVEAMPKP